MSFAIEYKTERQTVVMPKLNERVDFQMESVNNSLQFQKVFQEVKYAVPNLTFALLIVIFYFVKTNIN